MEVGERVLYVSKDGLLIPVTIQEITTDYKDCEIILTEEMNGHIFRGDIFTRSMLETKFSDETYESWWENEDWSWY